MVYFNAKIKLIIDKKEGFIIKNKYEDIEIWSCDCIDELYDLTGEELFQLCEDEYISVYGKRELINKLFKMFVADDFDIKYVDYDMTDDCREDTIYLMNVYEDASVSVETAYGNSAVKDTDATTAFIFMDDCKQEIIDNYVDSDKNVVLFDFDSEDEECNCEDCCGCDSLKGEEFETSESDIPGFTYSFSNDKGYSSVSFYSSDKDLVERIAKLYMK